MIALLAVACAAPLLPGGARGADSPTVLQFPDDRTVGSVLLVDGDGDQGSNYHKFAAARGRVVVPAGKPFVLRFLDDDTDKKWTDAFKAVKITRLDLQKMPFKDHQFGFLANFKQVTHLSLDRTDISDRGVKEISTLLPEVTFLGLSRTEVTSKCFKSLAAMKKLRKLHIGSNILGSEGFNDLPRLSGLNALRLETTQLTDADLEYVTKLKNLRTLKISTNKGITDRGLAKILTMGSLTGLNIAKTSVTLKGIASLKAMKNLTRIEFDFGRFEKADIKRLAHDLAPIRLKNSSSENKLPMEIFDPLH